MADGNTATQLCVTNSPFRCLGELSSKASVTRPLHPRYLHSHHARTARSLGDRFGRGAGRAVVEENEQDGWKWWLDDSGGVVDGFRQAVDQSTIGAGYNTASFIDHDRANCIVMSNTTEKGGKGGKR